MLRRTGFWGCPSQVLYHWEVNIWEVPWIGNVFIYSQGLTIKEHFYSIILYVERHWDIPGSCNSLRVWASRRTVQANFHVPKVSVRHCFPPFCRGKLWRFSQLSLEWPYIAVGLGNLAYASWPISFHLHQCPDLDSKVFGWPPHL